MNRNNNDKKGGKEYAVEITQLDTVQDKELISVLLNFQSELVCDVKFNTLEEHIIYHPQDTIDILHSLSSFQNSSQQSMLESETTTPPNERVKPSKSGNALNTLDSSHIPMVKESIGRSSSISTIQNLFQIKNISYLLQNNFSFKSNYFSGM